MVKEIDDIFAQMKKKKAPVATEKSADKPAEKLSKKDADKKAALTTDGKAAPKRPAPSSKVIEANIGDDDFGDSRGLRAKKRGTIDGLKVYSDKELNIGKGGDTPQCPFDCWCCY